MDTTGPKISSLAMVMVLLTLANTVGFTVSYFLAGLAAAGEPAKTDAAIRAAVFIGSGLAALAGGALLNASRRAPTADLA